LTLISLIYILFAILGLGFLVFIHELGHYLVARRQGMRVEAFAIGFGKPLLKWERDGVKWQICMLPFGGYVKIAGMQREGSQEPSEIPDGFFGKKPWQRIQVALAGPLVNIAFALVAFTLLWFVGGRDKPFAEFTKHIGWVDPKSALYEKGVRPGDLIQKYDGKVFNGFKDLLMASVMRGQTTQIEGIKVDYLTGEKSHFDYTLKTYENPELLHKEKLNTIGVLSPASYLIYGGQNLSPSSPMLGSGLEAHDRVLWVDGEVVFSMQQLSALTNESSAFLTVQRGEKTFQTKVPRIRLSELKMTLAEKGEVDDWQHEAALKGRLQDLYFIPYNLSPTLAVEGNLRFIDEQDQIKALDSCQRCLYFSPLQEGDQILAIDGKRVHTPYELLSNLQQRRILMIVDRNPTRVQKVLWTSADAEFDQFDTQDLQKIVSSIGTKRPISEAGTMHLLLPITPKPLSDLQLTEAQKNMQAQSFAETKKEIDAIKDPIKRLSAAKQLEKSQNKMVLGLPLLDREVSYNPTPGQQFIDVFKDIYRMISALFSGSANPKQVAGPIGIVQVVHQSWMLGAKEALFWMAFISLNLGIMNLLPLPVLDGGHILFSLIEMVTKKPIKAKTMERLIIPFVALLIGFFIFVTYNDLSRILSKFF
jgi:regulator of sigma E protease